jgi:N-acylneuraminate cytidylyltransferase
VNALVVIPARGGSKGVPGKNLRPLGGKPLLAHSIDAAHEVMLASTRVVVSSDDAHTLDVANEFGAWRLMRPAALATDTASTDSVILHALDAVDATAGVIDVVVLLQPTVPVRATGLVDACIQRLLDTGADSLLTANPLHFVWWREGGYDHQLGRPMGQGWRTQCWRRPARQHMLAREVMWHEDGSVYVTRPDILRTTGRRIGGRIEVFETERTVDIDTEADFAVAEALLARQSVPELP